jgi:hypothetical protein
VTFGPQERDLSTGRYPNGTGSFVEMSPTYDAENTGPTGIIPGESQSVPQTFILEQNYPNPFNAETRIQYGVSEPSLVSLSVYNIRGQEIGKLMENKRHEPGYFEKGWNSSDYLSGVYFYRLYGFSLSGESSFDLTQKMVVIK